MPPTETLKEVIKHRPPVAQVVKEITEESERDKLRQRRRQAEAELSHSTVQAEAAKEESGKLLSLTCACHHKPEMMQE